MVDLFYEYQVSIKSHQGVFKTVVVEKEDRTETIRGIAAAIREQACLKLEKDGLRDMQITFTEENTTDLTRIVDYDIGRTSEVSEGTIEIPLSYKSIYFSTKGRLVAVITKRIGEETSVMHRPIIGMFSSKRR